jgi:hypothetical protein
MNGRISTGLMASWTNARTCCSYARTARRRERLAQLLAELLAPGGSVECVMIPVTGSGASSMLMAVRPPT